MAEGADQQGLAQAGDAFKQGMTADEQARQHSMNDVGVPDDHFGDLGVQLVVSLPKLLGPLRHRGDG